MHFEKFDRVEYKHNILFEVLFQARFPEIMKISQETSESRIGEMNDVLTRCDIFKRLNWNIFQWSITDTLRETMGKSRS
jgi:hypothetical protein